MRILMINVSCGSGSTGRICTDIAKDLIRNGHDVKIAYGRGFVSDENQDISYKVGNNLDIYTHVMCSRLFDSMGFQSTSATKKLLSWIEKYKPDLIHLHNIHGYYLNVELLFDYIKSKDIPIVWTLHDCWAFTGHCAYFDIVNCNKWKKHCSKCPQKDEYPVRWGIDNSYNNFEKKQGIFCGVKKMIIVTPSVWLKEHVHNSFLHGYKTVVINNGIDLNQFKYTPSILRKKYRLNDKKVILGVSSVWDKRKGLDIFAELSERLDEKYAIILIGVSDKVKKKLPPNIIAINRTENVQELAEFYSMADIFLNPTLEDNYPTTNLESIACGTPVVTFNTGGSPESAKYYGTAVNSKDINGLINAINSNYSCSINRDILSYENTVSKYLDLYGSFFKE